MKRRPVNKRLDRKIFKSTANRVSKRNVRIFNGRGGTVI